MQTQTVLAFDIDNTLTGDEQALRQLAEQIRALRASKKLRLFLSTGRRLKQVLEGFAEEGLPQADGVISQVGTEIYLPPFTLQSAPLPEWERHLRECFSREKALEFFEGIEGLEMQPDIFNTPLKVSCYLDSTPDPDGAAALIKQRAEEEGGDYQVVWSSGRDLDIIPAAAGKGKAIRFLIRYLQLVPAKIIVAGDSGNDRSMFEEFEQGIVVANAQPELKEFMKRNAHPSIYMSRNSFAAGVEEGLRHFGVL